MHKKKINHLDQIFFESNRWKKLAGLLKEQDEAAPEDTPAEEAPAPSDPAQTGDTEPGDLDLSNLETGAPAGEGEEGPTDDEGLDAGLDTPDSSGGGFGGMSFSGGGGSGGFGDDGAPGLDADQPEEEEYIATVGPEDVEIPADPVMAIVDDAIQLLSVTKQPQKILQNIKSSIQRYFPEIEDATPIIKSLWDTEDVVLRDVAKRLLLFIKGI